ncbi:MAG: hypothetical protein HYW26_01015 [Candidatus Aenigmarchaeota archaeon]|nr:hypothetical protein [Candidatus Aenigmarchaeota archaeon]
MRRWAVFAVILLFLMGYAVLSFGAVAIGNQDFGGAAPEPEKGAQGEGSRVGEEEYDRPPPSLEIFHIPADPTDADTINITAQVIASVSLEKECIPSTGILSLFFGGCTETGNWIERTPNWRPRGIKIFINGEERKGCGFDVNAMFRYCKKGSADFDSCVSYKPDKRVVALCSYLQKFNAGTNVTYSAITYITPPKTAEEQAKQAEEERERGGGGPDR